ncbi:MAG: EAL domain-containing protein [Campylobacterales bacterium]|nr:EAL domain-containing protein [Campylobacterales bacterium]
MTYTEAKERSHRFALALRMGLPIFLLSAITLFTLLNKWTDTMFESFVLLSITLLAFIVYFIFYLIYQSTQENITDPVTHTFTPDYFLKHLDRARNQKVVSVMMITVNNLTGINERYGMKNGNAVLRQSVANINDFFASKKYDKLPICRFRGGDFLIYLEGGKETFSPMLELFLAKYEDTLMDEIEVRYEAVILDTRTQTTLEEMINRLYEFLHYQREHRSVQADEEIEQGKLEKEILSALDAKRYSIALQKVCCDDQEMSEVSVKLMDESGNYIHQNRFVPFLNREGKMRQLQSDVLEQIAELVSIRNEQFVFPLSSVILRNGYFFQFAMELLQRYPSAKGKIVFILEEKEYCPQISRFKEKIAQYRAVGYKIALDRLGGYHTTMLYLKELQVDFVRFDPLYARHIKEERYQHILQGLNMTAHLCGAQTWIPMIEDEEGDKIAKAMRINYRQGNFIGKITPLKEKSEGTL